MNTAYRTIAGRIRADVVELAEVVERAPRLQKCGPLYSVLAFESSSTAIAVSATSCVTSIPLAWIQNKSRSSSGISPKR